MTHWFIRKRNVNQLIQTSRSHDGWINNVWPAWKQHTQLKRVMCHNDLCPKMLRQSLRRGSPLMSIYSPASMVISPPYEGCPILTTCSSHEVRNLHLIRDTVNLWEGPVKRYDLYKPCKWWSRVSLATLRIWEESSGEGALSSDATRTSHGIEEIASH